MELEAKAFVSSLASGFFQENNCETKSTPFPASNHPELGTGLGKLGTWVWLSRVGKVGRDGMLLGNRF